MTIARPLALCGLFVLVAACTNGSTGPNNQSGKGGSGSGSGGAAPAGEGGSGGASPAGNGGSGGTSPAGNGGSSGGTSPAGSGGTGVDSGPPNPCPSTMPDPGSVCYALDIPGGVCPGGGVVYPSGLGCFCVMGTGFGEWMCVPMGPTDGGGSGNGGSGGGTDARDAAIDTRDTGVDTRDARGDRG